MKLGWKILWFTAGVVGWGATASATPMLSAPSLEYSQDGVNYQPFDVVMGRQKIGAYYDYHQRSGHPGFGTQRSTASTALYWDDKHHALSLIVISGVEGRGKGRIKYDFAGLPSTAFASLVDDPKEFKYKAGSEKAKAKFGYNRGTDGAALSGLEQAGRLAFEIDLTPLWRVGAWRLVDGDVHHGGQFIALDMSEPLFVRTTVSHGHHHGTDDPPVLPPTSQTGGGSPGEGGISNPPDPDLPEPGMMLTVSGLLGLLGGRRRG